jgi:opacity protein-like surface antigen
MTPAASRAILAMLLALPVNATAQSETPWSGASIGLNMGEMSSSACSAWAPTGAKTDPSAANPLARQTCSNGGHFVGGVQLGENFQYKHLMWGLDLDLDAASSNNPAQPVKYTGDATPAGTYTFSGRQTPNGFAIVTPRIGYGGDLWQPYLRAGALIAGGAHNSVLAFTPAGATKPTVTFDGARNFSSVGWVAGGGTEIGLNGPWSISLEYLHASLGRGSGVTAPCSGAAAACSAFSGILAANNHGAFTANLYRVGITYWFGYW